MFNCAGAIGHGTGAMLNGMRPMNDEARAIFNGARAKNVEVRGGKDWTRSNSLLINNCPIKSLVGIANQRVFKLSDGIGENKIGHVCPMR